MLFTIEKLLDDLAKQGLVVRNAAALMDRLSARKAEMQTYTPAEVRKVPRPGADRPSGAGLAPGAVRTAPR